MSKKQIAIASAFLFGCLGYGYFASQHLGAIPTTLIGGGLIVGGGSLLALHPKPKPSSRKFRFKRNG